MKKIITFFYLVFLYTSSFSQIDCITMPNPELKSTSEFNGQQKTPNNVINYNKPTNVEPIVFNIVFHIVKNTDGTGATQNYGEDQMMNAMKILNTNFNQFKIYFKYRGFDVIQNSTYVKIRGFSGSSPNQVVTQPTFQELITYSQTGTNPVFSNTAFNVFIVEKLDENATSQLS